MNDDVHASPSDPSPGPGLDPEPVPNPGGALPPDAFAPLWRRVEPWLPTRGARGWALAFVLLTVVHLVAQLVVLPGDAFPGGDVARVTKWLLMPLLAAALWRATAMPRPRLVQLAVVALLCSWAGDVVPDLVPDDVSFLVLMAMFLGAQLVYVVAFAPYRSHSVLRRRRALVVPYVVAYVAVAGASVAALLPQGGRGVPVGLGIIVYGAALTVMAILATGVDRLAGIGGVLFLVSDTLLGLAQALPEVVGMLPPGALGFAVMLTYVAAQVLLAAGVRRRDVRGHG